MARNDDRKKRDSEQQGLITTLSFGDPAPLGRYFLIVSAMAADSLTTHVYTDSISKNLLLSNAFCAPQTEPIFRFDKDPYEQYYKIILGRAHQSCIDVTQDYFQYTQSLVVNSINYGKGQNFYLKHQGNGRYKIFHSSGKVVAINLNRGYHELSAVLVEDSHSLETQWVFVDPYSHEIYKPL
jgi:hypothetical protein